MRRHTRLTRATRTERTETTRDPQKQKQKQGNCPARTHTTEAGQGPARLPRICWGGPHACEARLGSHGAATHTLPPKHTHSHKYTQAHPRHGRRRTKTLAARRVEDAEEVGPPRGGPPGWRGVRPLSPAPDGLRAGVRGACGRASAHRFRREEVVDDGLEAPAHGGYTTGTRSTLNNKVVHFDDLGVGVCCIAA